VTIARCLIFVLAIASSAAAQTRPTPAPTRPAAAKRKSLAIRPFAFGSVESFTAVDTFDAVFARSFEPFFGGGVQLIVDDKYVVEASVSRFSQTGQRAFISGGQTFRLGIPLTATLIPIEATAGYRFTPSRRRTYSVYVAGGGGLYLYKESSDFSDPTARAPANGVDVDTQHVGLVVNAGVETRVSRWISLAFDAQYTYVPGILGAGGVSLQAGESDLGGLAGRLKLVVGR